MENRQPASTARRSSRFGGSSRSGRQLISTALSYRAHAANTASASNVLSGRARPPRCVRSPPPRERLPDLGLRFVAAPLPATPPSSDASSAAAPALAAAALSPAALSPAALAVAGLPAPTSA